MEINADFLVIGSGVAGLSFALKVADHGTVALVTKRDVMESNTAYAQGGIAAVLSSIDSFDLHIKDTLSSGDNLNNRDVVEMVVTKGPQLVRELIDMGVKFSRSEGSGHTSPGTEYDLGREGGHSENRVIHADDMTGQAMEKVLVDHVRNHKNIQLYEHHIALDLITYSTRMRSGVIIKQHESYCCGAYILDIKTKTVNTFSSKITVLATGGAGKVYLYTSNPDVATGDGIAMGYRAGASVANLEFVQFHPTCLYHPEAKNFLISEAVRGEGGILIDRSGSSFMHKYDSLKDLACRDVVSRSIDSELKKSGEESVFLDISHKDPAFVKKRFPNLYNQCLAFGFDMTKEPIPVVPAAHYMCGGVATDLNGKTDINNLYAIGETACTGLHGANRLASNSLLEALVYGDRASKNAIQELNDFQKRSMFDPSEWDDTGTTDSDEVSLVSHNWDEIRRFMWDYVGVVRSNKRLERAMRRIQNIQEEIRDYYWDFKVTSDLIELRNIATVSELIITCAMQRKESRGLHYTSSYPHRDDMNWLKDTVLKRTPMP
ncbi:MAG: L-aspartate oxidase [Desulfobacteraceae bacterium]|nr:L-aspartate oxidase [Desulfobacteraceae bacterium]